MRLREGIEFNMCNALQLLQFASCTNNTDSIKVLIKAGADINCVDSLGYTPIHLVIFNNSIASVKLLIKLGANVNCANNFGETPFLIASVIGCKEIVKMLIKAGGYHFICTHKERTMSLIEFIIEEVYVTGGEMNQEYIDIIKLILNETMY
jgi:ankyrin repeat protein